MKTLVLLGLVLLATPTFAAPVRVILVGDSTTAPSNGWGDAFCADADAQTTCVNLAKNGRSSKSYRAEGSWAIVQGLLAKPGPWGRTYVFLQFGHNDQPGKPGRSSDFASEFGPNMAGYVADIRAAGARAVLITPLTRREFRGGVLVDQLAPWSAMVRRVAAQTHTPLLDLAGDSVIAVQTLGPVKAMDLAQVPPPPGLAQAAEGGDTPEAPKPSGPPGAKVVFDYTHLGPQGARLFSGMIEEDLRAAVPELARHFKRRSQQAGAATG